MKPLPEDELITMDFQDVDLNVVIKFMGELTGKNFLITDQVRGKVTIISPKKITVREAYRIFESVLEMNGYSALPAGTPSRLSLRPWPASPGWRSGGEGGPGVKPEDRMMTQVIPLEHASADELRNLLASSVSKEGMIISFKATNHLIITDRAANIHRLLRIIEQLDVPMVEEKISVLPLEHASAKTLADKLTLLMSADQRTAVPGKPPGPAAIQRVVRVIPDERTNILIVLANEQDTAEIRKLVSRLDTEAPRGKSQLQVIYLEHARAEELAKVLNSIVTAKAKVPQKPGQPGQAPQAEERRSRPTIHELGGHHRLPQEFRELEEVVRKLDTVRAQVLVEALITEVSMEKALDIGVEWRLMDQPAEGSVRGIGGTDFGLISGVQRGALPSPAGDTGLLLGLAKGFITVGGVQVPNIGASCGPFKRTRMPTSSPRPTSSPWTTRRRRSSSPTTFP